LAAIAAGGALLSLAALADPGRAFPLIWLGLFFLLDPLVTLLGGRGLSAHVARGRWDAVVALGAAGLTCGLLWETWNYWSLPHWVYHTSYLAEPKLFALPLLGYGAYVPFALEVYAAYRLIELLAFPARPAPLRLDAL
jgi:hypothetical protein